MKRWCWNCEKETKHTAYYDKYKGNDDNPTIMYSKIYACIKCKEGYMKKWYFRTPILRNVNGKRRKRYGK